MAVNLESSNVATRENRIGSITGYIGTLSDLAEQSGCGTLKGCSRCFSQSSTCLSSCALGQLSAIRDVAIIHHGPAGCSVASAGAYYLDKVMAKKRGVTNNTVYVGTDMNEKDTIFGSSDALRKIILEVNKRYSPKAIFVTSSCATGIIGEDIDSVVDDVRDEIDVPIVAVHCEGFKSRIWATGFDISDHAVLSSIVQPPKQKRNTINFKNFYESARPEIIEIFKNFDLEPIFLYCNSTVEELSHISESLATTCICGTLGNYLGNGLEEKYGVPYIRTINPLGIAGFETWLREIGRVTERSDAVEKYIAEQRAIYIPQIEKIKNVFLAILRDIKKEMDSGEQPGETITAAMFQTMQEAMKNHQQEPLSMDDVTAMIAGRVGQLLPMDEETAGQFQQLAKKMIELAGKETKIDGGNHDVTTKRSSM